MDGNIVGLAAVVMVFGIPLAAIYAYYRVRRLRTEERLAAIARGVSVPMEPELSQAAARVVSQMAVRPGWPFVTNLLCDTVTPCPSVNNACPAGHSFGSAAA